MTHDKMIAVIAHHKNGGKMEHKAKEGNFWRITEKPTWDFDAFDYRAKPETLVIWAEVTPSRNVGKVSFKQFTAFGGGTVIKFVEVEE
jgi:hypothetical protein